MRGVEIAAAASLRARPIPPALHQGESATVAPKWVPAAWALPVFQPGLVYDFPRTSGMHDILTYEMLLVACEREDPGEPIRARQPDDPGCTEPPAMRSAWQDDEPPTTPRRTQTHWALAWFFIVASSGLAAIALWQSFPDFWRSL